MRLDPALSRMLDDAGVLWCVRPRRRHIQLVVADRVVLTPPHDSRSGNCRRLENARATLRRRLRELGLLR